MSCDAGLVPATKQRFTRSCEWLHFFAFLDQIPKIYLDRSLYINKDYKIRSELLSK